MTQHVPRRAFIKAAGGGAAASLAWSPSRAALAGDTSVASRPRLLVGCCAYSYRQYLEKKQMTMEDFILKAVDLGVQGVDITTYWLTSTEPGYLTGLRHLAYRNGVAFSGAAIRTSMCQSDPEKRREELEQIRRWVDATGLLGAAHLRVFGGDLPPGASDEQGIQWVVETMKPACAYAAGKGIILGIESHGGITSKASNIVEILRRVDSPYAGCNLDISNFQDDPYPQIEACLPYATHTHIRDFYGDSKKPLDLERVWQMFAKAGYKGYMSAEYEGDEDPMAGVPRLIERMKVLCRRYSSV